MGETSDVRLSRLIELLARDPQAALLIAEAVQLLANRRRKRKSTGD